MKRILFFLFVVVNFAWSIPKPMESITNYNVMMLHGAYGPKNDDGELQGFDPGDYSQAIEATEHLGAASMGSYTSNNRVTRWISHNILEEPQWEKDSSYVRNSYVYNWRAFSNTRNSSKNNAVELGDRTWNKDKTFGQRRALVEEAQEVKAWFVVDSNDTSKNLHGQEALDSMRNHPGLFAHNRKNAPAWEHLQIILSSKFYRLSSTSTQPFHSCHRQLLCTCRGSRGTSRHRFRRP